MAKKTSMMNGDIPQTQSITAEERERRIATAAYYRALDRGSAKGDPVVDWLQAEQKIDAEVMRELPAPAKSITEDVRSIQRSSELQPRSSR